jgi:hypothetical protein
MKKYFIIWEIDIEAENAVEACRQALDIQRDKESMATVFSVFEEDSTDMTYVDLSEEQS